MKLSGLVGALVRSFVASDAERLRGGEKLIVCTFLDGWQYFLSETHYWILDRVKWFRGVEDVEESHEERFGLAIVSRANAAKLLQQMQPFRKSIQELRDLLLANVDDTTPWSDAIVFFPSLMVDFRSQCLFTMWPETPSFEDFVPSGWSSDACEFLNELPGQERYWVIDGVDHWAKVRARIPGLGTK